MNKKRGCKRVLCMLMAVLMICSSLYFDPTESFAAVQPVKIKVTYGQTEARGMLTSINAFRTSATEAWYWNESDSEKVMCQTTELHYDYELERIAMKRAAEIALSFSHTRPNNTDCFTAYSSSYRAKGENIAAGQTSASQVFVSWQETNDPYSGQGHRRNMLNSGFQAIGIGHVVYQGCHYWVQEFGDKVVDATPSTANDGMQIVDVDVDSLNITNVKTNLDNISLKVGEKATAEAFTLALNIRDFWGFRSECIVENTCSARIEDETIASLSDDLIITGLKEGTTKIWVSNPFGEEFYRTITVTKTTEDAEKSDISVDAIADQTYAGVALMPELVVKDGTKTLVQNVDYTVSYTNNINVGTATVTVTGIGEYEGSSSATFKIIARAIGSAQFSKIADQTYTGKAITPDLTIVYNGKTLVKNTDYVVKYVINNVKAGIATMTIQGKGNFTGIRSVRFKIVENKNVEATKEDTPESGDEPDDDELEEDDHVVHTTKIKLSKSKVTLKVGKTYRLKAFVDAGSVDKISFKSSNKKVATVSSKGLIKAKKAGSALITVTSGNKKKTCKVVVKK